MMIDRLEIIAFLKDKKITGINQILKHKYPEYYKIIFEFIGNPKNFGESLYCFMNNFYPPMCEYCNISKRKFCSYSSGYHLTCGSEECRKKSQIENRAKTMHDNPEIQKSILEKQQSTMREKYGVSNPSQMPNHKEKIEATSMEKFGATNVMKTEEGRNRCAVSYKDKTGYNNPFTNPEEQQRIKDTISMNPDSVELSKAKAKDTNLLKYQRINHTQKHISIESLAILNDKDTFRELLLTMNIKDICDLLNITARTIKNYHTLHELDIINLDGHGSSYEREISTWLSSLNIPFEQSNRTVLKFSDHSEYLHGNKAKELDFYFPEHNFAIEFQGDVMHMNPRLYNPTDLHKRKKNITASEIWERDKWKFDKCAELGITLLQIWEYDWNSKKEEIKKIVLEKVKYPG